jgi:plasmid stability protein
MTADETHYLYTRIPEELFQRLKALAKRHKRSVKAEVELVLEQHVEAHAAELDGAGAAPEKSAGRGKRGAR